MYHLFLPEVVKMRDCTRMKSPNEITAAPARDAFQRRASLFVLQEIVAIRSAFSQKNKYKIDLLLQAYMNTSLGVLFTSHLSPHILGGLCYCVWAIISDGDEWSRYITLVYKARTREPTKLRLCSCYQRNCTFEDSDSQCIGHRLLK